VAACGLALLQSMPAFAEAVGGYDGLGKALMQLFIYAMA
jgi:hypothetical protein